MFAFVRSFIVLAEHLGYHWYLVIVNVESFCHFVPDNANPILA